MSRGRTALVAATVAAEDADSVKGGADANAGGASRGAGSTGLLRASTGSSDGKKRDEKDGGNGDSPAVVNAAASLAGAVTVYGGRDESLSLELGDKRVDTDKPSGLGGCVRDKVPVCCVCVSTQMRPGRGKGASRRGSQSIGRVRVLITDWQGALDYWEQSKELQSVSRQMGASGGGRLRARVVRWVMSWSLEERHWFGPSAAAN